MGFPVNTRTLADVDEAATKNWWDPVTTPILLEALFAQGHSYKRLAELLGAPSDKAVHYRATEMGLPVKYPRRETAVAAAKATKAAKRAAVAASGWPKRKTCLKCRGPFMSQGSHNHLCGACYTANNRIAADLGGMF